MTAFPAVRAVMSRPSRMGTPLEISVPSVRVKRATAIFRSRSPISGNFSSVRSMAMRPTGVPYQTFSPTIAADEGHQNQETENAADKVAQADNDSRGQRQVHAQAQRTRWRKSERPSTATE